MTYSRPGTRATSALMWAVVALLSISVGLFASGTHSASAQTKRYHMDEYNSDITVRPDGTLSVVETLTYVYEEGSFRRGLREIPTDRLEDIRNVRVEEERGGQIIAYTQAGFDPDDSTSGRPGTFGTTLDGDELRIRWIYPPTENTSRTFRVSYDVLGAVRVYEDRDEIDWYAVPQHWDASIDASRVQLSLPDGVNASLLPGIAASPSVQPVIEGNTVTWTTTGNLSNGLEIGAQLPKGILQVTKPAWQTRIDQEEIVRAERERAQREYNERWRPLVDLLMLVLAALILAGGVLWGVMRWYRLGRDKPVSLLSDYITEPPSDLPPGLVGTLLDESADVRDVIATVVDLGRKGNLTIRETSQGGLLSSQDFEYTQLNNQGSFRFEEMVMNSMFSLGSPTQLSELKNQFFSKLPPIYDEMYRNLVALKYFPENPKTVRSRNLGLGFGLLVLGGITFFLAATFAETVSYLMFLPAIALGLSGLVWMAMSGSMPRKTDFGAEEAQKWRAFGRYLEGMKKYTDVQTAADKFQHYLPYAVALGIERQLIDQFNSVPAAMPQWYAPYGYHPYGYYPYPVGSATASGAGGSGGGPTAPSGPTPSFDPGGAMQGMSDSLASAMQGMSDSFTSMVNSASSALTSQPSSSGSSGGGGWGGGGGSFGGGGGGGGGGGAD